jgi:hypothetical protein
MASLHLRAKVIIGGGLGLLVLILPGSVRAQTCACPPQDGLGFPLGPAPETKAGVFFSAGGRRRRSESLPLHLQRHHRRADNRS